MTRFLSMNTFVHKKHRYLLRWPIYCKRINVQNCLFTSQFLTVENSPLARQKSKVEYAESLRKVTASCNYNFINFRQKHTNSDGSITKPKLDNVSVSTKKHKFEKKKVKTMVTEVTESSTTQTPTNVRLFKQKQLTECMNFASDPIIDSVPLVIHRKPNENVISLKDNPKLLKAIIESYENFIKSSNVNSKGRYEFIGVVPHPNKLVTPTTEELPHTPDKTSIELQKQSHAISEAAYDKKISLEQNLKAYLCVCASVDMPERGLSVLLSYRNRNKNSKIKVNIDDPELYLILMTKYAAKQNWSKISEIRSILVKDKIALTPQLYMTMFDCLGRMAATKENCKLIAECAEMATNQKVSLNDIFDKSTFVRDQREFVFKAIQRINSEFVPVYTPPILTYTNKLCLPLNQNVLSVVEKAVKSSVNLPGSEISNAKVGFNRIELKKLTQEQLEMEMDGRVAVRNISTLDESKLDSHTLECRKKLNESLAQWRIDICKAFKRKMGILQHKMTLQSSRQVNIYPYLCLLKPEQFVDILIDELKTLSEGSETYTPIVAQLYGQLGRKVQKRYQSETRQVNGITEKTLRLYKEYSDILCSGNSSDNPRQLWQRIIHHDRHFGPCYNTHDIVWPWPVQCDIGRFLLKILLENIQININLMNNGPPTYKPVLYTIFRNRDLVSREELRVHPKLLEIYRSSKPEKLHFEANLVPMVCPPIPWISSNSGGYLITHSDLVRLPVQYGYQIKLINKAPKCQMYPSLDALNQLGSVPWRINTRILDLVIEIFNLGGSEKLHVPLTPNAMLSDIQLKYRGKTRADCEKSSNWKLVQRQNELYSLWCDALYKLSLANHFRDKTFWLPHNMDFRGRVYPVPPHLNHLSSDLSRSLMYFYQKKPLGEHGLQWLKLHCINLTGLKKRESIQHRLEYADKIMHKILDSADNPLSGRQWWLSSDEPWQTLAACIEIANASRSPDPVKYMSSFPIHQDGSCNGLQHYAALGRDSAGAVSVNLSPSELPQDVYSTVSNLVEKSRVEDANNGESIAQALSGYIKRKTVKQTIMTTVYGVTYYGAQQQIEKQLKNVNFPSALSKQAACYLTRKTFDGLSEMFSSAREIQNWLTACARYISRERQQHVEWISPLGLPVIQPYTRKTNMDTSVSVLNVESCASSVLNNIKEKNAFSPNFIHSLDSCHMMLTSLNCEKAGITFVSVHDCFWTHASSAPLMNRICREQFVLLHSQPILEDLSRHFYRKYEEKLKNERINSNNPIEKSNPAKTKGKKNKKNVKILEDDEKEAEFKSKQHIFDRLPKKGTFNLKSVLESIYFFS